MHQRSLVAILILTTFVLSCDKDEEKFDPSAGRYLPLHVGNSWKLVPENPLGFYLDITVTEEVTIHDKKYFKVHRVSHSDNGDPDYDSFQYIRMDAKNDVYLLNDSLHNVEVNIYRLGAPHRYQWKLNESDVVTVIKSEEQVNTHTFSDCKGFFYNDPSVADEETSVILASNIGYLKVDGSWGRTAVLSEAYISGTHYDFSN